MSRNLVVAFVVILLLVLAGWYLTKPKQTAVPQDQSTQSPVSTESAIPVASEEATMSKEANTVTITQSGFLPKSVTIKVGETVTWINDDSASHTVNSDLHPIHTLFPILNKVSLIKAGEKKSLQFTTAGTFTYHDHLNPSSTGSVTVQ